MRGRDGCSVRRGTLEPQERMGAHTAKRRITAVRDHFQHVVEQRRVKDVCEVHPLHDGAGVDA
jgi:hypothetical protein